MITFKDETVYFIEVKSSSNFGKEILEKLINKTKKKKILECSLAFLKQNPKYFDMNLKYNVAFYFHLKKEIEYIEDAIQYTDDDIQDF